MTCPQDVPIPAFMQNKSEDEWSEEEKKAAQEYERKVKELNEEREKYRKVGTQCMSAKSYFYSDGFQSHLPFILHTYFII